MYAHLHDPPPSAAETVPGHAGRPRRGDREGAREGRRRALPLRGRPGPRGPRGAHGHRPVAAGAQPGDGPGRAGRRDAAADTGRRAGAAADAAADARAAPSAATAASADSGRARRRAAAGSSGRRRRRPPPRAGARSRSRSPRVLALAAIGGILAGGRGVLRRPGDGGSGGFRRHGRHPPAARSPRGSAQQGRDHPGGRRARRHRGRPATPSGSRTPRGTR